RVVHVRSNSRPRRLTTTLLLAAMVLALLGAGAFAWWGWHLFDGGAPSGAVLPIVIGVVATLAIGCGLMALMFYSSRHGYDRNAARDDDGR
ncbi:MAG TPA: hypothetical protein VJR58_09145, partial [Vineibacter sp.]|nr:hypothetical protein [Vineibacter sp.]